MKTGYRKQVGILIGIVLFFVQACGTVATVSTATPLPVLPTITPIPVSQQVTLTSISFREEGQSPIYTISAQTPKFAGSDDPRAQGFNKKVDDLIQGEIEYFRKNILAQISVSPVSTGSFFDAKYTVVFQNGELWSLKFDFMGYADGAAHPYHYSMTFNYDLEQGAEPTPENYRNWNITPNGLVITFDEYQVAPYAAGAQTVIVPYEELKTVMDPRELMSNIIQ